MQDFFCAGIVVSRSVFDGTLQSFLSGMVFARVVHVLSPILFTVYVDSLLDALRASGRGCYWHRLFAGALCYADDLTILAPSADGLRIRC